MIDSCAFTGSWPFRRLSGNTVSQLSAACGTMGIQTAVVSCLESIFYNDPNEGDGPVSESLPEPFLFAMTHNPMLPFAVHDIETRSKRAVSVRLFPGYHSYDPACPESVAFCSAAAEAGLPITIVYKMDDIRMDYLMRQSILSAESIFALAQKVPKGTFIISGFGAENILRYAEPLNRSANVYADTSYTSKVVFPIEAMLKQVSAEKLLFATHQPMLCPESAILTLQHARISDRQRSFILYENAKRIFGIL